MTTNLIENVCMTPLSFIHSFWIFLQHLFRSTTTTEALPTTASILCRS